jgi:hypothetical protein
MRWQLPIVWILSSVVTGTIAVILSTGRAGLPIVPLFLLSPLELLTLVVLVGVLALVLFAVGRRTIRATWLRWNDPRSVVLWTLLVIGCGFAGWSFAAVVTFESGFSLTAQLILAYTCGGLPFTLVAAMLARKWQVNAAALMVTAIGVLIGLVLVPAPLPTLISYLQYMFGGGLRMS